MSADENRQDRGRHNASPSSFGWEFQTIASIALMLDTLKDNVLINVEGEYEDAEITKTDGSVVYIQAKSSTKCTLQKDSSKIASYNSDAKGKLKKALDTFKEHVPEFEENGKLFQFVYICNMMYPLGADGGRSWSGFDKYYEDELTDAEREFLNSAGYEQQLGRIRFCSFEMYPAEDYATSKKTALKEVGKFLIKLDIPAAYSERYLREMTSLCWNSEADQSFTLKKEHFIANAIQLKLQFDQQEYNNEFGDYGIPAEIIEERFSVIVNQLTQRYECLAKVLSEFASYETELVYRERKDKFISSYAPIFIDEHLKTIDSEYRESLAKYIISVIINRGQYIKKANKEFM